MARKRWIPGLLALVALVVPLWGCELGDTITVEIPDFDSGRVEGLWLWRQAPRGRYQRVVQLRFLGTKETARGEMLRYAVVDREGRVRMVLPAEVERSRANPDRALLRLNVLFPEGAGRFRASAYNAAGESGLSAQVMDLGRT